MYFPVSFHQNLINSLCYGRSLLAVGELEILTVLRLVHPLQHPLRRKGIRVPVRRPPTYFNPTYDAIGS
jgi:hypothetical protein